MRRRAAGPEPSPRRDAPGERRRAGTAVAFLGPLLAVFLLFYLWPALNTVASSFFRWSLLRPWKLTDPSGWDFAGLANYTSVLTSPRFWNSMLNTGIWLVLFPLLVVAVSLAIAIGIWFARGGGTLFRTVFVLPMTISLTAAGVIWALVYNPDFGVVEAALGALGLDGSLRLGPLTLQTGSWLSNPGLLDVGFAQIRLVNLSLVVAGFWAFTGFGVITFTAGLTAIPGELVDAARVDGATARQIVRHVVIPALRGPMVIVAVISVIFALRTFDIVWVMTQGGPAQDTEVLAVLLWKQAFAFLDSPRAGEATAIAVLMSVVLVAIAYPYLRRLLREGTR